MSTPEREPGARPPDELPDPGGESGDAPPVGEPAPPGRRRRQVPVETAADEAIRQAMARGDFDNLPGRGRPLRWDTERDDAWWLANHMLKNAGYRPSWIESDQAIRAEREALRQLLDDHVAWHRAHAADESPAALRHAADQVAARYRARAEKLNREIDGHNLTVPVEGLQRLRLQVSTELSRFHARLDPSQEG